jgi:hypothetical protein
MSRVVRYVRTFVFRIVLAREVPPSHRMRLGTLVSALICSAAALATAGFCSADPGELPQGSKRVFEFTVVGCPAGESGDPLGRDREIYVTRDAADASVRIESADSSWRVTDANGTSDHAARLAAGGPGTYDVYVRVLTDAKTGDPKLPNAIIDWTTGEILCKVATVDLSSHRQSTLELTPSAMFEAALQEHTWSVDRNPGLRIAQLRVYARAGARSL